MKIHILTIGKVKDPHLEVKIGEYLRRLRYDAQVELTTLKDSTVEDEGKRLLAALDKRRQARVFVLSEDGKSCSSIQFSAELKAAGSEAVFVIGGPEGLASSVKARADLLLSLSQMTFPHETALLILTEQLFRGFSILRGGKYHK